ncbi:MAG: zf-HC2 domain-containing protein, partial [Acidobacteria bacterium]|nr:zf-HC2 domain-containing protein [Acidobacteriota bacterium]
MSGHIASESLSAFVDGEAGPAEERQIAAHLAGCADCRSRLAAMRRLVGGLQRLAPAAPPADLAALVRSRVAAQAPRAPMAPSAAGALGAPRFLRKAAFSWRG